MDFGSCDSRYSLMASSRSCSPDNRGRRVALGVSGSGLGSGGAGSLAGATLVVYASMALFISAAAVSGGKINNTAAALFFAVYLLYIAYEVGAAYAGSDDCLVPAPEDARRRRPTSAVRRRRDLEHAGRDRRGLPLGRRAGGGVAREAVSPGWGLCRATKGASTSRHRADVSRTGRERGLPRPS